ncbi:hypothetical protein [Kribbella sp.]|uniref:hypothetical protein n=1 Tax=Kribbella sp. TaxID=1871183 RepID=UPI002D48F6AA|nr:hypothetical protein [Kribbella sp.]HZX02459.1 hypothetical protein [Kribbella sp.]
MEPLNLLVSLSHSAKTPPENKHGLGERVGRQTDDPRTDDRPARGRLRWFAAKLPLRWRLAG